MSCSTKNRKLTHAGGNAKTKSEIAVAGFQALIFPGLCDIFHSFLGFPDWAKNGPIRKNKRA
jgi:hypothetical protein